MKEIFSEKGVAAEGTVSVEDLELINSFSRRPMNRDEVYTFKLILCDNEIDRDFEQFSPTALSELAPMFVGKTGIFDHSMKSRDQTARIFKASVEIKDGIKNSLGEPYVTLTAYAYMPKTDKNSALISDIDAGILKEVSVGCSVHKVTCSVCGANLRDEPCAHAKGERYSNQTCYHILSEPSDAYEWSFVAVPAQRNAGISKSFKKEERHGEKNMADIMSILKASSEGITLSKAQTEELVKSYECSQEMAKFGEKYCSDLREKLLKLCAVAIPEMDANAFSGIMKKLDADELSKLENALEKRASQLIPPTVQLAPRAQRTSDGNHNEFII